MPKLATVTGMDLVIANMKAAKPRMGEKFARGLKRSGLLLQRESQKIVPVDKGNLKASAFTRNVGGTGWLTDIVVGFTASYAIFVHEDLEAAHGRAFNTKYAKQIASKGNRVRNRGENQTAKFLEKPFRLLRRQFLAIIREEMSR